jgi:hypothetical protein
MPLGPIEVAYLEYVKMHGGSYTADASTLRQIAANLGAGHGEFEKTHKTLVNEGFLAVPSGGEPFNRTDTSFLVSITAAGIAAIAASKQALAAQGARKQTRTFVWWNPTTWLNARQ